MRFRLLAVLFVFALAPGAPVRAAASCPAYIRPVVGPVIRHFEPPPTPYSAGHRGIDLAVPAGTPVRASASGIIHFAGQVGGSLFVSIDHPDGTRTTYSFLSAVLTRAGRTVAQGEVVARSGAGHAGVEPAHLHFGMLRGSDYLDPEPVLIASMRCDLARVIRLASVAEPSVSPGPSG